MQYTKYTDGQTDKGNPIKVVRGIKQLHLKPLTRQPTVRTILSCPMGYLGGS